VLLKGKIPFSVPVGVRDDVQSFLHDFLLLVCKIIDPGSGIEVLYHDSSDKSSEN
jgi:hypothetical protein